MAGEVSGFAVGSIAVGGLFVYGALTNRSPLQAFQAVVKGSAPGTATQGTPLVGSAAELGTGAGAVSGDTGKAIGGGSPGVVASYFQSKKIPVAQTAGAMGNIQIESGFDPSNPNPGEGAIGLCQWEGGRRTNLQAFAASRGTSETDLQTQLDFMWSELHGPDIAAFTAWRATSSPSSAASVWDSLYERSAGTTRQERISAAQQWYKKLGGT